MDTIEKYPPVILTEDYQERLKSIPIQVFWSAEDEPILEIPPESGRFFPYGVALQYELVKRQSGKGVSLRKALI